MGQVIEIAGFILKFLMVLACFQSPEHKYLEIAEIIVGFDSVLGIHVSFLLLMGVIQNKQLAKVKSFQILHEMEKMKYKAAFIILVDLVLAFSLFHIGSIVVPTLLIVKRALDSITKGILKDYRSSFDKFFEKFRKD